MPTIRIRAKEYVIYDQEVEVTAEELKILNNRPFNDVNELQHQEEYFLLEKLINRTEILDTGDEFEITEIEEITK